MPTVCEELLFHGYTADTKPFADRKYGWMWLVYETVEDARTALLKDHRKGERIPIYPVSVVRDEWDTPSLSSGWWVDERPYEKERPAKFVPGDEYNFLVFPHDPLWHTMYTREEPFKARLSIGWPAMEITL